MAKMMTTTLLLLVLMRNADDHVITAVVVGGISFAAAAPVSTTAGGRGAAAAVAVPVPLQLRLYDAPTPNPHIEETRFPKPYVNPDTAVIPWHPSFRWCFFKCPHSTSIEIGSSTSFKDSKQLKLRRLQRLQAPPR